MTAQNASIYGFLLGQGLNLREHNVILLIHDSGIDSLCRWPGYLDNTVAGGIPSGLSAFEALVKECMEEASIAAEVVRKHVLAAGAISYFFRLNYTLNHVGILLKLFF